MSEHHPDCYSELEPAPLPRCPKCQMRMITVSAPTPSNECLRCGYTEQAPSTRAAAASAWEFRRFLSLPRCTFVGRP